MCVYKPTSLSKSLWLASVKTERMFFHEYIVLFLLAIGLLNASALLHLSPYCREGTVVSVVNEDAPAQFAITLDNGPTPAAGVTVIIMPLPGKLDEWQAIPFRK